MKKSTIKVLVDGKRDGRTDNTKTYAATDNLLKQNRPPKIILKINSIFFSQKKLEINEYKEVSPDLKHVI